MTLRELRQHKGFTLESLAAAVPCDPTTLSQIELGKTRDPRYSTMTALAKALGVSVDAVAKAIRRTPEAA